MKRPAAIALVLVLAVCVGAIVYAGKRSFDSYRQRNAAALAAGKPSSSDAMKVLVEDISTGTLERRTQLVGTVEATANLEVVPEVAGRLLQFNLPDGKPVEEGAFVKAGEVVGVIEHDDLDQAVKQAEAALDVTRANAERARVDVADAQREKNRIEALYKEQAVSQQLWDKLCAACDRANTEVLLAEAQVKQAEAALQTARMRLADATIKAPISGIISEKCVDKGDMIGPGRCLVRIAQVDSVKVSGDVAERYLAWLHPAVTVARVSLDAHPDRKFEGILQEVGVVVNPVTRTVKVKIVVPNSDHAIKPGMFARVELVLERRENVTLVNDAALLSQEGKDRVFRVTDTTAHRVDLKLGLREAAMHEVLEGLRPGDVVVTRGQQLLKDGDKVEVVREAGQ